jgi:hypothetical protein
VAAAAESSFIAGHGECVDSARIFAAVCSFEGGAEKKMRNLRIMNALVACRVARIEWND